MRERIPAQRRRRPIARFAWLLLALAASVAAPAAAPRPPPWPKAVGDLAARPALESTAAAFPNSAGLQRRRLAAALAANDREGVLDALRRLGAMGASLSAGAREKLAPLVGTGEMPARMAPFDANARPVLGSRLYATVPVSAPLVEGLVWEPRARRLYAASVVGRRLVRVGKAGEAKVVAGGGLGSLFGGAWDAATGRIWVASAIVEQTPAGGSPFSGLVGIDPGGRRAPVRLPAPAGATLGDVAVAPDGIVYASDGLSGAVYRARPGGARLEPWVAPGALFSAQGMAASADGRWLYVADYRYGLAAVERSSGRLVRVSAPPTMMLDGIDGLVRNGDDLVAVQNGVGVARIVRLRLSPGGLAVARLDVLERVNPAWGEPTLATIAGRRLLYVADSQWDRYGAGGALKDGAPARPTPIRAVDLGAPRVRR